MGRKQSRGARNHGGVARPVGDVAIARFHEHHHVAGADLGGRHADGVDPALAHVVPDLPPGDRPDHQLFQRLRVEESVEPVGQFAAPHGLGDLAHAQDAAREPQQVPGRQGQDFLDPHLGPDIDEARAPALALVGGGGEVAGVDRADRRAAEDVELHGAAEPPGQFVAQVAHEPGFVGAPGAPAGKDQRAARSAGGGF